MIQRVGTVLLLLGALLLLLGTAGMAVVALASGDLSSALSASGPLLVLFLGFLGFGLWSSIRGASGTIRRSTARDSRSSHRKAGRA